MHGESAAYLLRNEASKSIGGCSVFAESKVEEIDGVVAELFPLLCKVASADKPDDNVLLEPGKEGKHFGLGGLYTHVHSWKGCEGTLRERERVPSTSNRTMVFGWVRLLHSEDDFFGAAETEPALWLLVVVVDGIVCLDSLEIDDGAINEAGVFN